MLLMLTKCIRHYHDYVITASENERTLSALAAKAQLQQQQQQQQQH